MRSRRFLSHPRYGRAYAWLKRNRGSRRQLKNRVRDLYLKSGLVHRGCVLCGSDDFTLLCENDRYGFDLQKQFCNRCGLVQTQPSLPREFHREFYRSLYRLLYTGRNEPDYDRIAREQELQGKKFLSILAAAPLGTPIGSLHAIEIGCSCGGILKSMKPAMASVRGCDLDEAAISYARSNLGLDLELSEFPVELPDEGPRLFILSHVLEHLYDPREALSRLRSAMRTEDLLFIAVPNMNKVADGAYKNDLLRYFHIGHVTDFTADTLSALLQRAGFSVVWMNDQVEGLFRITADHPSEWERSPSDTLQNIARIERTRARKYGFW